MNITLTHLLKEELENPTEFMQSWVSTLIRAFLSSPYGEGYEVKEASFLSQTYVYQKGQYVTFSKRGYTDNEGYVFFALEASFPDERYNKDGVLQMTTKVIVSKLVNNTKVSKETEKVESPRVSEEVLTSCERTVKELMADVELQFASGMADNTKQLKAHEEKVLATSKRLFGEITDTVNDNFLGSIQGKHYSPVAQQSNNQIEPLKRALETLVMYGTGGATTKPVKVTLSNSFEDHQGYKLRINTEVTVDVFTGKMNESFPPITMECWLSSNNNKLMSSMVRSQKLVVVDKTSENDPGFYEKLSKALDELLSTFSIYLKGEGHSKPKGYARGALSQALPNTYSQPTSRNHQDNS